MTLEFINKKLAEEYVFGNSAEWWIKKVKSFPHNEWVMPTGKGVNGDDDYKLFEDLFYHNLCEKRITPIWHNGSFKGRKIEFKISIEQ